VLVNIRWGGVHQLNTGERTVEREEKRQHYLAKAQEADKVAAKAKDPNYRASWVKLAETYRQLARDV
jgi:hypothetical protein